MTDASAYQKPVPIPDEDSQPFFAGAREHRLMFQRCAACGTTHWPVKSRCPQCLSKDLTWVQASGQGTLYTFTRMHQLVHPGFAAEIPCTIAEIDLAEGPRVISTIVGCSQADLRIGMALEVTFEDLNEAVTLPKFRPVAS